MLPIVIILAFGLACGWIATEVRGASRVPRIALGLMTLLAVAYACYLSGRFAVALEYSWVPKEQTLLAGSMHRIGELIATGDTGTVAQAVAIYSAAARASSNEFGHYQAVFQLSDALKEGR